MEGLVSPQSGWALAEQNSEFYFLDVEAEGWTKIEAPAVGFLTNNSDHLIRCPDVSFEKLELLLNESYLIEEARLLVLYFLDTSLPNELREHALAELQALSPTITKTACNYFYAVPTAVNLEQDPFLSSKLAQLAQGKASETSANLHQDLIDMVHEQGLISAVYHAFLATIDALYPNQEQPEAERKELFFALAHHHYFRNLCRCLLKLKYPDRNSDFALLHYHRAIWANHRHHLLTSDNVLISWLRNCVHPTFRQDSSQPTTLLIESLVAQAPFDMDLGDFLASEPLSSPDQDTRTPPYIAPFDTHIR